LLRLTKHWSESGSDFLELDLRKEKHLAISRFLHQSILLKLDWCKPQELEIKAQGNFHENWNFEWSPDQEMTLIQAAIHASTIEDAIYYYVLDLLEQSNDFISLAHTLEHGLKANLDKLWPMISDKINLLSIKSNEVESLCALIRPLISTISYGNLYQMDTKILEKIINQIIPKIILEFGTQCSFIKGDKAKRMLKCLDLISTFFLHSENIEYHQLWKDELINNSNLESIHPLVRGKIWYKILEDKYLSEDEFITELEYQLLNISDAQKTAYWIEGFMYQSTSFYLMQDFSLTLINHWISQLEEIKFKEVLPLLRRSFSELNTTEILRIKTKLRQQSNTNQASPIHLFLDPERTKQIETMLSNLQ
ncbi:MAG: DUF5682 family protein, partial [Saprospiraceae bacterium]